LTTSVHEAEKLSLDQIRAFLQASQSIRFEGESRSQVYHWIEQVLCLQQYHQQSRGARGLIRLYLAKMTGRSRAQVTRLITRYRRHGTVQPGVDFSVPLAQLAAVYRCSRTNRDLAAPAVLESGQDSAFLLASGCECSRSAASCEMARSGPTDIQS